MADISAEKKKIAADCFRKGSEAMSKEHWDYAIDMFGKSVALVPDNLLYRQTLRGVEHRKYGNNKTGARMASMKLMGVKSRIKKARLQKNWPEVDRLAEEGLTVNPWDAQLNADVGEACFQQGFTEVATFAYTKAIESDPNSKEYHRQLALVLEQRGQFAEASQVWQRVLKLDPLDGEARTKSTQLSASHAIDKGGYEGADSTRATMADHEVAKRLKIDPKRGKKPAVDGPGQSAEADLQRAIRKAPKQVDNYLKLADLYRNDGRLEEARELLLKALELSGDDIDIQEQAEDVELLILKQQYDDARTAAMRKPDDEEAAAKSKEAAKALIKREIEVYQPRVQRHPNDTKLKFELASRLMQIGRYQNAIPLLQQCVKDQRFSASALVSLGKCFLSAKQTKLAKRQLEKAVLEIDSKDDQSLLVEAHYWLGRLCEDSGEHAAAEEHYSEVLAIDYEYKDTLQRIEKLQL